MDKILVVAAHPDDEVLGCGGTIAKYAKGGDLVSVLILGTGVASRYNNKEVANKKEICDLKKQAKKAADILGVKKIYFSDFPDNSFDSVPILNIIKEIERIKKIISPLIIYTHHYGDLNIDHCITYKAVLTACRPAKRETVSEIYSFEVPSSTEWAGPNKETHYLPDKFIDISETLNKKIAALKCYKKEIRLYPHPRSVKGIEVLAAKRGMEANLKFAESFKTIRVVK